MRHARLYLIVALALILLTTACGAQATGGAAPQSTAEIIDAAAQFIPAFDLPTLQLTYDQQGIPRLFGISTTTIESFTGIDLSILELDPAFIDWFTRENLQHVAIENTASGLLLYANGNLLPSIGWDSESLQNAVMLAETAGVQNTEMIQRVLPIIQKIGLNLVLRFPTADGADAMPLHQRGTPLPDLEDPDQPSLGVSLAVNYRDDGLPTVLGLTSRDIEQLTGANLRVLELTPAWVDYTKAVNLQNVEVETHADGLQVFVNGQALPYLSYSPSQLDNLTSLYGQLYPQQQGQAGFLRDVLTLVQQADVDFVIQLPRAPSAAAIPLHDGVVVSD
jgi:hypothetical protein